MKARILLSLIVSTTLVFTACGKKQEAQTAPTPAPAPAVEPAPTPVPAGVAVSGMMTGSAIGADKQVTAATDSFAPSDTIYVSVDTTGSGTASLAAKWTYHKGGQVAVVQEDSMTVIPAGPATHEFHVSKPDGWPAGDYQVEVMLDGQSADTKRFTVK